MVNVSNEDIILNKGMTLCFVWETDVIRKTPHTKEMDMVNIVNNEDMKTLREKEYRFGTMTGKIAMKILTN